MRKKITSTWLAIVIGALALHGTAFGQANTASLLDLTNNTVISNFPVGPNPQGVAWAGNSVAYVTNEDNNTLVRLNMTAAPPTVSATYSFPAGYMPNAVAVNPAGTLALVSGDGTSLLLLDISGVMITLKDTIAVIADAGGLAFYSPNKAIVADESNVLFLDVTNVPAVVTTVSLGNQAHGVAVNSAGTRAVVSIDTGGLQLIDLTTVPPSLLGNAVGPLNADPLGVAISPDGTRAIYVDEEVPAGQAHIVNITGAAPAVVNTVTLQLMSPSAVAFNPVTSAALIAGDDGVSILDPPYTSVLATIPHPGRRGATTYSLAVNPAGTRALVLHEDIFFCPYPIAFGSVVVSTTLTVTEVCVNSSASTVTVTNVLANGTGFGLSGVPTLPVMVPAGGAFSFNMTFTPGAPGAQTGGVTISYSYVSGVGSSDIPTSGTGVTKLPVCVAAPSGLASWWPGDANAYDIIGLHHGTLAGNATFAPALSRNGFSFPTAGSVDIAYSDVATPAAITVAAWVNPASTPSLAPSIFNWRPLANDTGISLEQRFTADGQVLWNVITTGGGASVVSGANLLPLNQWTHVAGTYDGTTATLYFNGSVVGSGTTSGALKPIAANARIGRNIVTNGSFNGAIDEVEVYSRALSAGEIAAIVAAGAGGHCRAILDIDADGRVDALTDGLLVIRHLFGLTGSALTAGAVSPGANRSTAPVIQAYLTQIASILDADANARTVALNDGLLVLRYMFGFRGAALVADAVGAGATRTPSEIETYIQSLAQ